MTIARLPRLAAGVPPRRRADSRAIPASVLDEVCQSLLASILDGTLAPGARLSSERDLSAALGVSRVAVREALRRLQEWRVVECRPSSGTTVLPRSCWTGMALGACLSHALGAGDLESVSLLVQDSLELRRSLLLEMIERAAPRLAGQNLDRSRALAQRAWTHRGDVETFLSEDRELIPGLLQEAALWASLWALNSLAETYLKAMSVLGSRFTVPTSYLPAMSTMIAALETGDGAEARRALDRYLDDLDRCIAGSLTAVQERRQRR